MRFIKKILHALFTAYCFSIFFIIVPFMVIIYICLNIFPDRKRILIIFKLHRIWIKTWEVLTGIHFTLHGADNLEAGKTYVFVMNHVNILDILIAGSMIQHYWKALGKLTLTKIPFVGFLFSTMTIAVDRSSKESRQKSMETMVRAIDQGMSIMIFPEGTRNRSEAPLMSFYPGAFRLAINAQVPILPMVMTHTRLLQPQGKLSFRQGKGYLHILPPIEPLGSEAELSERTRHYMESFIIENDPYFSEYKPITLH